MTAQPRANRLPGTGWLKNGNRPGNPGNAPRCGAKTRAGTPCRAAAMKNGRCRMHGGSSTGPRTAEGLARIKLARRKHGRYTPEAIAERREARETIRLIRTLTRSDSERIEQAENALDALRRLELEE